MRVDMFAYRYVEKIFEGLFGLDPFSLSGRIN